MSANRTNQSSPRSKNFRVAVVTNYSNINYGSVLQSYALQKTLQRLGCSCENIQWDSRTTTRKSLPYRMARAVYRSFLWRFASKPERRRFRFRNFIKSFIHENSQVFSSMEALRTLNKQYDAFVCGSDQIWAPNQFHERYYLGFVDNRDRKIAYAPSIGLPNIPPAIQPHMRSLINDIAHLSVREPAGADIIQTLTGRSARVVLDPTLLLEKQKWLELAGGRVPKRNYVLWYFLGENLQHRVWAEKISRSIGLPIAVLPFKPIDDAKGDFSFAHAGPRHFLSLVQGAEWILTDSFHGMLFSILMNKPFSAFLRFAPQDPLCQNSRVEDLLARLDLSDRIVTAESMTSRTPHPIDYTSVNRRLDLERKDSIAFLDNALQTIE